MAHDPDGRPRLPEPPPVAPPAKQPYEPPAVTTLGSVAELTQSGGLTKNDAMGQRQKIR
jgi:hypothetical protein